jgi:hypothetical protein
MGLAQRHASRALLEEPLLTEFECIVARLQPERIGMGLHPIPRGDGGAPRSPRQRP